MKKIISISALLFAACTFAFAQNDARKILDQMGSAINAYKSLSIDFEMIHDDFQNNKSDKETGRVIAKDTDFKKYKITMDDSDIYCDGVTKWVYMKDVDEIDISLADFDSEEMNDNPVKFFTMNRKDMKYSYKETVTEHQKQLDIVDFYPKDKNAAYTIIRMHIEKSTHHPLRIKYFGKDGNNYIINITKVTPNLTIDDKIFNFDVKQYPTAEIVDLR